MPSESAPAPDAATPWSGYSHRAGEERGLSLTWSAGGPRLRSQAAVWHYRAVSGAAAHGPTPAPRLLMIHGFRGDHHGMQLMVDALPEFEIFVPDLPGFNATPPVTDDAGNRVEHTLAVYSGFVGALAEALQLTEEDVLAGHSFGTIVTAAHVAETQRPWAGLVLSAPISTGVFTWPLILGAAGVEAYYEAARLLPVRAADALLRSRAVMELTNRTLGAGADLELTAYVRDQHAKHFGGYTDRQTLIEAYRASSRHTVTQHAPDLDLPVLVLPGTKDQLSTRRGLKALRGALPDARMEMIRDVGHLIHYAKPAETARAVKRFLADLKT